uniref:eRF1/Pelota-like N-terminal domain-containing protein n=1 Tax=viral metagenome TaxID=1070528 RepID=A0A6C0BQJ9_9ZZZZ
METLDELSAIEGHGTSMITLGLSYKPASLDMTRKLLHQEYGVAGNIKSRV